MESFCDLETSRQEQLRFAAPAAPRPPPARTTLWERIIRHAGQIAVDHTHLLPLDTLERPAPPALGRRCGCC